MGSSAAGNLLAPRSHFTRVLFVAVFCVVLLTYSWHPLRKYTRDLNQEVIAISNVTQSHPRECSLDTAHLRTLQEKYCLEDNIDYAKRYIRFHRQDISRKSITKLDKDLFPEGFDQIDIQDPPMKTTCLSPLEVPVPNSPTPNTVDGSSLLLGVSTTYKRLTDNSTTQWPNDPTG